MSSRRPSGHRPMRPPRAPKPKVESDVPLADGAYEQYMRMRGQGVTEFVYYIVELGEDSPVKIGYTNDLARRCVELQCGNPRRLECRQVIEGDKALERRLHNEWRGARLNYSSEWFGYGYQAEILAQADRIAELQAEGPWGLASFDDVAVRPSFA